MPSAPLSPVMPSEPNVLPVSPAPGSATSFTPAVPGPHLNVDHNTPAARQPQTLQGSSSTVQPFSKILSDIGATPSEPDVDNAPSKCNPPLTDRAFRYQRRDASRAARIIHAGMFDPTDTLSTFDPNDSIESPAQNSVSSRLLFPYSPPREFNTQHVAVTCPPMTHAPTAIATAGAGASLGCCRGTGAAAEYCTRAGAAAEYCTGAGAAAEYCTGAEECVVGSTVPIRRWGGATGARPAEVYCAGAGVAAEYCTAAEECAVGSTSLVRRGGGATGARPAEVYCT